MEEVLYYNELYDLYGELLTSKQKKYFEDYYFHNLSYSEMASNYDISRNAVFRQLHITLNKLKEYESILKLHEKKLQFLEFAEKLDSEQKKELLSILS